MDKAGTLRHAQSQHKHLLEKFVTIFYTFWPGICASAQLLIIVIYDNDLQSTCSEQQEQIYKRPNLKGNICSRKGGRRDTSQYCSEYVDFATYVEISTSSDVGTSTYYLADELNEKYFVL